MEPVVINIAPEKIFGPLIKKLQNMKPLMRMIASDLKDSIEKNFIAEGRPTKWTQLAKSTIEERTKLGYWPGKILQRRGGAEGLLGSIHSSYDETSAAATTNKEYAEIHQFGGEIKQGARSSIYVQNRYKRNSEKHKKGQFKKGTEAGQGFVYKARTIVIPARPFMVLPDEDIEAMKQTVNNYLFE